MRFSPTDVKGVEVIDLDTIEDARGAFARVFCAEVFAQRGLNPAFPQINLSINPHCGTLRGMHLSRPPYKETKVVRCIRGAIFDVALDMRSDSPSYLRWVGVELSADNRRSLYIPPGVAHGFQTLLDNAEVLYLMGASYTPEVSMGVRFDDPTFSIRWPLPVSVVSERDRNYPDYIARRVTPPASDHKEPR